MIDPKRPRGRPWPADHVRKVRVLVNFSPDVLAALDGAARDAGLTRTAALERILRAALTPDPPYRP